MLTPFTVYAQDNEINGKVSTSDAQGLFDIQVELYVREQDGDGNTFWSFENSVMTDAGGNYSFTALPAGTYHLRFEDNSDTYVSQFYDNQPTQDEATDIVLGSGDTPTINGTLARAGFIDGKVQNANLSALEDIRVTIYELEDNGSGSFFWSSFDSTSTSPTGEYGIRGLREGTYRVGFHDSAGIYLDEYFNNGQNDVFTVDEAADVSVTAEQTTTVDIDLNFAGFVAGTVTDSNLNHPQDISVILYTLHDFGGGNFQWTQSDSTRTDENGTYQIAGLHAGNYRLGFQDFNGIYLQEFYNNGQNDVFNVDEAADVLVSAQQTSTVDIELNFAGFVAGTVTDSSLNQLEDIDVTLYTLQDLGNGFPQWAQSEFARTDENGNYQIGALHEGTAYRVGFRDSNRVYLEEFYHDALGDVFIVDNAADIFVTAQQTQTVDIALNLAGHIAGAVTGEGDAPLPGVRAEIYALVDFGGGFHGWSQIDSVETDQLGQYDIGGLQSGTYRVGFNDSSNTYIDTFHENTFDVNEATDVPVTSGMTTTVDMQLTLAGHIAGTVRNLASDPLANIMAQVYALVDVGGGTMGWSAIDSTQTGENGEYSLRGLRAGTYRIGFQDFLENYLFQVHANATTAEEGTDVAVTSGVTTTIDISLTVAAHITGTVKDTGGNPIPEIRVEVYEQYDSNGFLYWSQIDSRRTDAQGNYDIGSLRAKTYRVGFVSDDLTYAVEFYDNAETVDTAADVVLAVGERRQIDAELLRMARLQGVVQDENAQPLENVDVILYRLQLNDENVLVWRPASGLRTTTAADGSYEIAGIPPGEYRVGFEPFTNRYATVFHNGKADVETADSVNLVEGENPPLDAQLPENARITGRVTSPEGPGIAGISVRATRREDFPDGGVSWQCCFGGDTGGVQTDANGDYDLFGLEAGDYVVQFVPPFDSEFRSEYFDNKTNQDNAQLFTVTQGDIIPDINATLSRGGIIKGVVTNDDGLPVEGVQVQARPVNAHEFSWFVATQTTATGAYTLTGLPPDNVTVGFFHDDYSTEYYDDKRNYLSATPLVVGLDTLWTDIDAVLSPRSTLSGTVFGPDGNPVAGINVTLYFSGTFDIFGGQPFWRFRSAVQTDDQGHYSFEDINGDTYRVGFQSDIYLDEFHQDKPALLAADDIELPPDTIMTDVDATLAAGSEITGTVLNDAGEPISGTVTIRRQIINPNGSVSYIDSESFDFTNGSYSIKGRAPGIYRLRFTSNCCATKFYANSATIEGGTDVVVDQPLVPNINIQLDRNGGISGKVADDAGAGIAAISVNVFRKEVAADGSVTWRPTGFFAQTDSQGNYALSDLAPGIYHLHFLDFSGNYLSNYYGPADELKNGADIVVTSGNVTENVDGELLSAAIIRGRVTDEQGFGIFGITVRIYRHVGGAWRGGYQLETDFNGNYDIELTEPGEYRIGFFTSAQGIYGASYYRSSGHGNLLEEADIIAIAGSEVIDLNDSVMLAAGSISGTVLNKDNAPFHNVTVQVYRHVLGEPEEFIVQTETGDDGTYLVKGLGTGDHKVFFLSPTNDHGSRYYDGSIMITEAVTINVTSGQTTSGIDITLPGPVPPLGDFESGSGKTDTDPNTGESTQNIPNGNKQPVTVTRHIVCPEGDTPANVTLTAGSKSYSMTETPAGSGNFKVTIPVADLTAINGHPLVVSRTCNEPGGGGGTTTENKTIGKVILYDPSGFVTDVDTGEAIVGATVRLYNVPGWQPRTAPGDTRENTCQSHNSKAPSAPWSQEAPTHLGLLELLGSGRMSPDLNPQLTDEDGHYAWDVAEGCWYVTVAAPGYITTTSPLVGVPPAVTDLDLTLERSTVEAAFSGTPTDGPTPLTVFFTDESQGAVEEWEWHFGDGDTASIENPAHIYDEPGVYTVWLKVTGPDDSHIVTRTNYIEVSNAPVSGLAASNDGPTMLGDATQLHATVTGGAGVTYAWSFGDGTTGTGQDPTHTYTAPGSYTAVVTATNSVNSVSASTVVEVVDVPIGTLTIQGPSNVVIGVAAIYTVTASDGTNIAFVWDFDSADGEGFSIAAISLDSAVHTWEEPGVYTVTVTASNGSTIKNVKHVVTAVDVAVAGLTVEHDETTTLGQPTEFSADVTGGSNVVYAWDFGDGATGSGQEVSHTYAKVGEYDVTVTATNSNNSQSATVKAEVVSGDTAIAGLTIVPGEIKLNAPISFEANITTGTNVDYTWSFADGGTAKGKKVTHTYTEAGEYDVKVTAKNSANQVVAILTVIVDEVGGSNEAPTGLSASSAPKAIVGQAVQFNAAVASGDNVEFTWDFGDGATATGESVQHTYTRGGTFTVTVTAANSEGSIEEELTVEIDFGIFLPTARKP